MTRIKIVLFLVFAAFWISRGNAQNTCPFKNGDNRLNSQYPEIDSSCVHVQQNKDNVLIWSDIPGSKKRTHSKTSTVPVCTDIAWQVTCRRICGDLPPGKHPTEQVEKGITPPGYAQFEDKLETFVVGDHTRVCMRVRNWANKEPGVGTVKTFTFRVPVS